MIACLRSSFRRVGRTKRRGASVTTFLGTV